MMLSDLQKRYAIDQYSKNVRIVEIAKQIHANRNSLWWFLQDYRKILPDPKPYNYSRDDSGPYPGSRSFTVQSAKYAADLYMQGYKISTICDAMAVCRNSVLHVVHDLMNLVQHPAAEPFAIWVRKNEMVGR